MSVIDFSDYKQIDSEIAKSFWFGFVNQGPGLYKAVDPSTSYEYLGNISSYDLTFEGTPRAQGREDIGNLEFYQVLFDSEGIGTIRIFKI